MKHITNCSIGSDVKYSTCVANIKISPEWLSVKSLSTKWNKPLKFCIVKTIRWKWKCKYQAVMRYKVNNFIFIAFSRKIDDPQKCCNCSLKSRITWPDACFRLAFFCLREPRKSSKVIHKNCNIYECFYRNINYLGLRFL